MNTDDNTNASVPSEGTVSTVASRQSVLKELFWGGLTGILIALAIGVPTTLVKNLLLHRNMELDSRPTLIDFGMVAVSGGLGITLLVIVIPAIRKARGTVGTSRQPATLDLRWAACLGGAMGVLVGAFPAATFWWHSWTSFFGEDPVPMETWQLETAIYATVGYILACGCGGAAAVVTGLILADRARRITDRPQLASTD